MKKYLLGAVLAAGLALALLPQQASAYWTYKTSYRWDPCTCSYVCYSYRCWVPDCDPCYPPPCYDGCDSYGCYDSYSFYRHGHGFEHGRHHRR
jgi:hypothetical protein